MRSMEKKSWVCCITMPARSARAARAVSKVRQSERQRRSRRDFAICAEVSVGKAEIMSRCRQRLHAIGNRDRFSRRQLIRKLQTDMRAQVAPVLIERLARRKRQLTEEMNKIDRQYAQVTSNVYKQAVRGSRLLV